MANAIKTGIKGLLIPGITITGEWVANLPTFSIKDENNVYDRIHTSADYHFFIQLHGVEGLPGLQVTNNKGIEIALIDNTEIGINNIVEDIKKQGLINCTIFK